MEHSIMLDVINKWAMNFFTKKEETVYRGTANPNATNSELDAKKVICYVDEKKVDCFVDLIESRGYQYSIDNDWWERTWSTDTGPKELIKEVYQRLENGSWNQLMIGYGDNVFYEEKVDEYK